ncbi:MAG: maltose alpha-D-glucosyltransferase [Phototrophicaceae bacterium]
MSWYTNSVFYQVYLRAFRDGDGNGHGDFLGLREKADYLQWLGVDCVWLMPTYPSPLKDDGYDIASFYGIHNDYGLLEDFRMTVQELHRRGIKLIADLVVNHTSDQHPWFVDARRSKDSAFRNYYVWNDNPDKFPETRIIFLDTEESNWAYDERTEQYYWHRFYSSQPDLNYDNPKVQQAMLDVMKFWLDMGIDGFRVDAVPYLIEREGTINENLPETHDYLKRMRALVDAHYPNALLLAEANQWASDLLPYFGDNDEFHMCFHFPVMPRLYMALAKKDRTSIIEILNDTPAIPEGTQWATFLRNHDELTLEMVTEEERQFMWDHYSPDLKARINLGIRRRLAPLMGNDRRKIELMNSMLYTLPGTPVIYYGDEIGMGDDITLFDRNGVRTPMQWDDSDHGGFSDARIENLYAPPISDPEYGYKHVNVKAQQDDPDALIHVVRNMIKTYKQTAVLADGELVWEEDLPTHVLAFWRRSPSGTFLAIHNLSDEETDIQLPANANVYRDILRPDYEPMSGHITLQPYAYYWLVPEA